MPHVATVLAAAHHSATTAAHSTSSAQTVSASSLLVQMVIGLAVIIALIKVASRILQGRGARALGPGRRQGSVAVVGRQSLGKGVQVAVVAAAEQTYLVGVTQHQVTMLGRLSPAGTSDGEPELVGTELQLVHGDGTPNPSDDEHPSWKSAIEQMRSKTLRRA